MKMENFQKLLELKKDLTGIDNLAIPSRVRLFVLILEGRGDSWMLFTQVPNIMLLSCLCLTRRSLSGSAASASSQGRASSKGCSSWYDFTAPMQSEANTSSTKIKASILFFSSSSSVQRFLGVHQSRDDPVQPV